MDLVAELADVVPRERLHAGGEEVERHGGGFFTYHAGHLPDVVVFPGVGSGKAEHLRKVHEDSSPCMRQIKCVADPNGVMNPGKIFADDAGGREMPEES